MVIKSIYLAKVITIFILSFILLSFPVLGQKDHKITLQEYIQTYQHIAVQKMRNQEPATASWHAKPIITSASNVMEPGMGRNFTKMMTVNMNVSESMEAQKNHSTITHYS